MRSKREWDIVNVLSLFDGMSCGQIALERAGIKVDNYFASEINKQAIAVTMDNYPNTIQLGDVTKWYEWDLPKIDLLIGGSPCQGFSTSGKGLNFEDPRSKLFFEFTDVLNAVKPDYFMLENVKMKKRWEEIITNTLYVHPIEINSSLVSAQNRKRMYWTNIPNVTQPKDKEIKLVDILEETPNDKFFIKNRKGSIAFVLKKYEEFIAKYGYEPKMFNPYNCAEITEKSPTLTAVGSRISTSSAVLIKESNGDKRQLTPLEWERLQTVPDNYTEAVNDTQRFNMLGNGWTVDVIKHIFEAMKADGVL